MTPQITEMTDRFGNVHHVGLLGIVRSGASYVRRDPVSAVWRAGEETWNLSTGTLKAVWQMIVVLHEANRLGVRVTPDEVNEGLRQWVTAITKEKPENLNNAYRAILAEARATDAGARAAILALGLFGSSGGVPAGPRAISVVARLRRVN